MSVTPEALVTAAHAARRRGWAPLPLHDVTETGACSCEAGAGCPSAGKHPRRRGWQEGPMPSGPDVQAMWDVSPRSNLGIRTGIVSGLMVLDVDRPGALMELVAQVGPVPDTHMVRTGSGGLHLYWAIPEGVRLGNGTGALPTGIDVRGDGGFVVAPPSVSAKGPYIELHDRPLVPLPEAVLALIQAGKTRASAPRPASAAGGPAFADLTASEQRRLRAYTTAAITREVARLDALPTPWHEGAGWRLTAYEVACSLLDLAESSWSSVTVDEAETLVRQHTPTDAVWGAREVDAQIASAHQRSSAGRGRPMPVDTLTGLAVATASPLGPTVAPDLGTAPGRDPLAAVQAAITAARTYQDLPDPGHLVVAMAAAVTRDLDDDPVWVLIVAAPSSGKTETTRALDLVAEQRVDDLTAAGLLSWKAGKNPAPTGLLTRLGDGTKAVATLGDLSTLLASSDRGGRDTTFALLRKVYDGHVVRDLGNAPGPLQWTGKLTVVAAVTGAIDHYAAHNDALGPRWVYYRLSERDTAGRRRASKAARRGELDAHRKDLAEQVSQAVTAARQRVAAVTVPEELADEVEDAALVTCWGRAAVPRHGYGRREIDGVPVIEEPMRLVRQLLVLTRGLLALGLAREHAEALVRRVALDSMPLARRAVLGALAFGEELSTSAVASAAHLDRHVARRQLEELEAIGVITAHRAGREPDEEEPDRRSAHWSLRDGDGELIAAVINQARRDAKGWTEVWRPPTPPPQGGEETTRATHTSVHPAAALSLARTPEPEPDSASSLGLAPGGCARCGSAMSRQRHWYGKAMCVACESAA